MPFYNIYELFLSIKKNIISRTPTLLSNPTSKLQLQHSATNNYLTKNQLIYASIIKIYGQIFVYLIIFL